MTCLFAGLCPRSLSVAAAKAVGKGPTTAVLLPMSSLNLIHSFFSNAYDSSSSSSYTPKGKSIKSRLSKRASNMHLLELPSSPQHILHLGKSNRYRSISFSLSLPKDERSSTASWALKHRTWVLGGCSIGICVSFSSRETTPAEARRECEGEIDKSVVSSSHGKKVYRDYSITGIPGDGRCLFRSVAHGACVRCGKSIPDEALQRKLADELRNQVANEFIKRQAEIEWFIEGDFDSYVSQMRRPYTWGGEPELLMASHVLRMPITVYMHDEDSGGLIEIAEYGQEYGKDNPIRVLYHGFGHYDALQIPGNESRL